MTAARLVHGRWRAYTIAAEDGGQYSADAGDYWDAPDSADMGGALMAQRHEWRTITGQTVMAPRLLKARATVGDLRRLERAGYRLGQPGHPGR